MTAPIAYVDHEFVPATAALLPVTDAGLVQGITVSEHLRTYRGKLFQLDAHWQRLAQSLAIVGVQSREPLYDLSFAAEQVAKHNFTLLAPGDDLGLIIAITPGDYGVFARLGLQGPRTIIHTYPLPFARWVDCYRTGVKLMVAPQVQVSANSWPRHLKCRSRMHYYLADQWAQANEPGTRALLLDEQGQVNETSSANIVAVLNSRLVSPPRSQILPGTSLTWLEQLANSNGWVFEERNLDVAELLSAQEVLLTSTPNALLPVVQINRQDIGTGQPGAVFGQLLEAWSQAVGVDIAAQARRMTMLGG